MVEGWPAPAILVQGSSVQWSKRVPAAGAALDPATGWYNVFLHLRVYPDALPLDDRRRRPHLPRRRGARRSPGSTTCSFQTTC